MKRLIKLLLSLAICWHLLAVLLLPNSSSILHNQMSPLRSYGNLLSINVAWTFFSTHLHFGAVEYDANVLEANGAILRSKRYSFPSLSKRLGAQLAFNRTLTYGSLMSSSPMWAKKYLGPILCRQHSDANQIVIFQVNQKLLDMEAARLKPAHESPLEIDRKLLAKVDCLKLMGRNNEKTN